jgi:hypothetical protein
MSIRSLVVTPVLALGVATGWLPAQAAPNHLYDKFQITGSGAIVLFISKIRVDGKNGTGTDIDPESDLGLATSKFQGRAALRWRPGKRHELELGYLLARRSGEKTLARDIDFGDTTFAAGATVKSKFNSDQAFLVYRFAFTARENTQIGAGLGVGTIFFDPAIDALASGGSGTVEYSQSEHFVGPTASLGLYGRFRFPEHWYLEADLRGLKASVDRITASVIEGGVAVRYFFSRNFGLEGGYGLTTIKVDIAPKSGGGGIASGSVKWSLQNIRLGVVASL